MKIDELKEQEEFSLALKVFDNESLAIEWFATPIPAINERKPIDLFSAPSDRAHLVQILNKMRLGEFS